MEKTIVVGLGNPFLTDDGVGVIAAYHLQEQFKENPNVYITEASVGGIRLMELLTGYDNAIIIDALMVDQNVIPGKIHKWTLEDLEQISPTQHSASAHDTSLVTALQMGAQLGMKLPEEITIYAVEVTNVLDFSTNPTPEVADAIPEVVKMVIQELGNIDNSNQITD